MAGQTGLALLLENPHMLRITGCIVAFTFLMVNSVGTDEKEAVARIERGAK